MYRSLSIAFGLVLLLTSSLVAIIPQQISYQGKVSGPGNWTDTTVAMTFNVYSDSNGVASLWTETQSGIAVKGGLFSVQLGKLTPIPSTVFNGAMRWLGVTIGTGPQLVPLTRIVSQPNAYHALGADTATTVVDNAITSAKIANGTIQFGDIGQNGATTGKIIKWNGSAWTLANDSVGTAGSGGWTDNGAVVSLTNSNDTVGLAGTSTIRFGSGANRITGLTNDLRIVTEDLSVLTTEDVTFGKYGMGEWVKFDNLNKRVGIGTLTVDELLHVENDTTGGIAFLKLQTSHATNFGEAGLRVQTPENTWHWRMDDYTHNNLPNAGSLALRSGDLGSEVMTWLEDGKVGVGTTNPNQKLHVYGNARIKDTLMATTLTGNFVGTYKNNSIDTADIKDEPGIASRYIGAKGLTGTPSVIDSVVISVPAAGYVWVIASGSLMSEHTFGDWTLGYVWINDSATAPSQSQGTFWIPYNLTGGYYEVPFSCQAVFRVSAAGTYTYYSGGEEDTDAIIVYSHTITAAYFPTNYGTVEVSPVAFEESSGMTDTRSAIRSTAASESRTPPMTGQASETEIRLNTLSAKIEELQRQVDELRKE